MFNDKKHEIEYLNTVIRDLRDALNASQEKLKTADPDNRPHGYYWVKVLDRQKWEVAYWDGRWPEYVPRVLGERIPYPYNSETDRGW